ncbi:MAG: ATP phosphoribosyltransferase [Xanthomonadales bacterium]|nr:ATP phosphoribosyltransferase [Xanthomonadales bacterium]MCC6594617.1 ATP phosphoribosyltransferase [Xanthomonadales bacterium]MCE7930823.1 ATP phosphoribosyltransferase [Xanthomonadales bacterium PRO6]
MSKPRDRLRIAVQKSGRLSEASQDLLARCGLKFRQSRDKLFCFGEALPIDLLLVRDDDIPGLIGQGVCELGIVGRNVAQEQALDPARAEPPFVEVRELGFGRCRLAIAVADEDSYAGPQDLGGKRIATSYPHLLGDWLRRQHVAAEIVVLNGSVEIAPRLGTADLICDLVSSGATLAANQLREVASILDSQAVLIGARQDYADERAELRELLLRRIDGVIRVRESKLLLLQADPSRLASVLAALPKGDPATVGALDRPAGRLSVQVVCHEAIGWAHLEELKRAGATQLLVLPVEKMLT